MDRTLPLDLKNHPEYESTITEVIGKNVDPVLMAQAIKQAQDQCHAEAIYVKLKLQMKKYETSN